MSKVKPDRYLSLEQIEQYCRNNNIDYAFCIECGALICESDKVYITLDGKKLIDNGGLATTFLNTRIYNGHEYRVCRCKECVAKKFPYILNSKRMYGQKWSKCCKYAFGVSDEDFDEIAHERQKITREKMINRWGIEEGERRWQQYCNKQAQTNTFEYKKEKYGWSREEFDEYNSSRAVTLDNCIARHGEEKGREVFERYREQQRYTTSLEYFIEKYGEEKGKEIFENFDELRYTSGGSKHYSIKSKELFDKLTQRSVFEDDFCYYAENEYRIDTPDKNGVTHPYRVDFYDTDLNLVIEYQGILYHNDIEKDLNRMKLIQNKIKCAAIFVDESAYIKSSLSVIKEIERLVDVINNVEESDNYHSIYIITLDDKTNEMCTQKVCH